MVLGKVPPKYHVVGLLPFEDGGVEGVKVLGLC